MAFLDNTQVAALGLASVGADVLIDEDARIMAAERVQIGSHVRIDAFAVLSAGADGIVIGDHVHVAAHCLVTGAARIELGDFAGISGRVSIYSSSDDFAGESMTGPTVPADLRSVDNRPVRVGRHVIVGAGAVILPGITIHDGSAVAALSVVREDVPPATIVGGIPAHQIGVRSDRLFALERQLKARSPEAH